MCICTLHTVHSSHLSWSTVTIRRHEVKPAPCGHDGPEPESRQDQGGEGGGRQVPPTGSALQLGRLRSPQVGALGEPHHDHPWDHRVVWEEAVSPQQEGRVRGELLCRGSVVTLQRCTASCCYLAQFAAKTVMGQRECLRFTKGFLLTLPQIQITFRIFFPSWWKRSKELFLVCICYGSVFMERCFCLYRSRGSFP